MHRSPSRSFLFLVLACLLPVASLAGDGADAPVELILEVSAGAIEATPDHQALSGGVVVTLLDAEGPLLELRAARGARTGARLVLEGEEGVRLIAPAGSPSRARGAGLVPWLADSGLDPSGARVTAARVTVDEAARTLDADDLVAEGDGRTHLGPATVRLEAGVAHLGHVEGAWRVRAQRLRVRLHRPGRR